ncbi:helix-turn-helix domain-containing protein [Luteibacter sp. PPL201]|uniref:Helix-turn-helix domain-containing protein n=1 Tax=Luteibacter sahnii TaxID=3021977 RepID=A0ABT6BCS0_9GAMM|nr:helix-turn-helix domain-containing protein [Luteibacter sp. PPL193]MDY1549359.1 helix-turn-helix domain-containing protein [Luteibacter sp. PPL193]
MEARVSRWREHLRVVVAVDRLSRGRSIVETALELGYSSASRFTALFTRLVGAPPRRYLAQRDDDRRRHAASTALA